MSQLTTAVQAIDTGNRKILRKKMSPLFDAVFNSNAEVADGPYMVGKQLRIEVRLGVQSVISDADLWTPAVDRAKKQIVEAVFGEFRPHFRLVEQAIYNYDAEEAGRLLREMEKQMFEVDA